MKILLIDNGIPFNFETPYESPLGGSEITILLYAKGLANLNHQVVLLNNNNYKDERKNLILDNINLFIDYANLSDIIILNRFIPESIMNFINKKKIFYFCHDAYDQQNIQWMLNQNAINYLDKIICVSEWQKNTLVKYMNVNEDKIEILPNPIDRSLYLGYTKRDLNKLIFASIPYKGLEVIPDLFCEIKNRTKNEDLNFDIYSSFQLYGRPEENQEYADIFRRLDNIENINIYEPISMKELAYKLKQASLYIAPSTYHETFGRVFVEAMASGCLPVALNNGANKEVIKDYGFIIDYANVYNLDAFDSMVETISNLIDKRFYQKRIDAEKYAFQFDYMLMAKKMSEMIEK